MSVKAALVMLAGAILLDQGMAAPGTLLTLPCGGQTRIIEMHKKFRNDEYGVNTPLVWDTALAYDAATEARTCVIAWHSSIRQFHVVIQTGLKDAKIYATAREMIDFVETKLTAQKASFKKAGKDAYGVSKRFCQYLSVIEKSAKKIGCAVSTCGTSDPIRTVFVCMYDNNRDDKCKYRD